MADVEVSDGGTTQQEAVGMGAIYDPKFESAAISASVIHSDTGAGADLVAAILATLAVADTGSGAETPEAVTVTFWVDPGGVLNPLGVIVLRDSRYDLAPPTRDQVEEIPGKHGEIDFGTEFGPRPLELHVAKSDLTADQRGEIKRLITKYFSPLVGPVSLVFWDEPDKTWMVKYSGRISQGPQYPAWIEVVIPLKMSEPFLISTFTKSQAGTGTLVNGGNVETPLTITIAGAVTNPSVVVGTSTLSYTGSLGAMDSLVIDTDAMTVKLNGANAIANYTGGFPKLAVGNTAVTAAAAGTTTWSWRNRWI